MGQVDWATAVYTKLTADQTAGSFYDDVGGRIYMSQAPKDASLPLVVWSILGDVSPDFFSGTDLDATFQVDVWFPDRQDGSTTDADLITTNDKLVTLLDRVTLTSVTNHGNVQTHLIDKGGIIREDDGHHIVSVWQIVGTVTS